MSFFGKDKYEPEHPEGPEAEMYRLQKLEDELRQVTADRLIDSLTPEDGQLELFSYWEITTFGLKQRRKYPSGGNS